MPRLRVELRKAESGSGVLSERIIEGKGVRIGRGADCDWVLEDPQRRLSRIHCELRVGDDGMFVTDLSSNGIFLNEGEQRLPRGEPCQVTDGDRIAMGDYVLGLHAEVDVDPDATVIGQVAGSPAAGAGRQIPPPETPPLEALLAGLDLDSDTLADNGAAEAMFRAGSMLRCVVRDLHDLLSDRSIVKAQFQAEQTLVRTDKANPFKTLPPDDLAAFILGGDKQGYLPVEEAVEGAFRDIKRHQMALLSGMHDALSALIERFSPEEIERALSTKSAISVVASGGKKAAAWDVYRAYFDEIEQDVADLEASRFMADFRSGYEARLRELEDAED